MARIRELTETDISPTAELLATSEPRVSGGETPEQWCQILQSCLGRGILYVAEEDARVVGLVYFFSEPIFAQGAYIRFLVVRADMRRKGIGRQLMGFVERKVFRRASTIYVCVSPGNEPALRFCEKVGYLKVAEIPDSIASDSSEWILRKIDSSWLRRRTAHRRSSKS